jgi:hypothetical protein
VFIVRKEERELRRDLAIEHRADPRPRGPRRPCASVSVSDPWRGLDEPRSCAHVANHLLRSAFDLTRRSCVAFLTRRSCAAHAEAPRLEPASKIRPVATVETALRRALPLPRVDPPTGSGAIAATVLGAGVFRAIVVVVAQIPRLTRLNQLATASAERRARIHVGSEHRSHAAVRAAVLQRARHSDSKPLRFRLNRLAAATSPHLSARFSFRANFRAFALNFV